MILLSMALVVVYLPVADWLKITVFRHARMDL
jgi:hypothetical protein